MCNMPGGCRLAEQLRYVQQGHGRSGNNRDYVLATVKSIEAQGFRDPQLHQLAMMLHDCHPLAPASMQGEAKRGLISVSAPGARRHTAE